MPRLRIFKLFLLCAALGLSLAPLTTQATTVLSPIIEIALAPGSSQQVFVKVLNETTEPLYLKSSIEGFVADGEQGTPRYLPADQAGSHVSWITLGETSIVVQPQQVVAVPATITVPANATPGGYYAVVFWQTSPGETSGGATIGVAGKVGTLVLITVTGDLISSGEITSIETTPAGGMLPALPERVGVRFANTGNVHLRPTGTLTIRKGDTVILTQQINDGGNYALPGSTRRFDVITSQYGANFFRKLFSTAVGRYQIEATIQYEEADTAITTSVATITVIPYYGITAIIVLIITGSVLYRSKHRIISSS